ncbi:hypothetical protein HPB52_005011 [Rhipicephalus sanguineus]|uniref:Uncharacterized protein n=1 Tax=Rhipicephalus sanguineus TaxID=34632 RepID=A0A9D4QEM1_RHISA|nr:hypothetical protein HPB52_005011 [Rhipicephalus sanguineus]
MEEAVSSRKKTSATKSRGREDHPASEVGDSEDGAVSRRNEEVCDNDSESPPPLASKVAHSTACQDGTALLPKRSRAANRGETFDDNRREEMEVEPQSTEAASAVVSAPQVAPSTPVYAPTEVRSSGSCPTETKESETTEMGPAVPQEMPSALAGIFDNRTRARPLSEDQVLRLYGGAWLNGRKGMVADFVTLNQEKNLNRHSLYVLLANYLRSRELLSETTSLLEKLREEMAHCESNVWDMVSASVTGSGSCGDNKQFSGTHRFNQAQYNGAVASRLASCSQQMHALLREKHVVCMHNVSTIRVQIDYHIQLVVDGASLGGMQSSTPVTFKMHPKPNCDVSELMSCISVLFLFLRKGAKDKAFVDEVQSWLQMLSNLLLRVASLADHFFLLNHVLSCPPGIHKWAVSLVQVPNPLLSPEDSDCNQMLDYALTVLATILSPVKAFKEYLQSLQKNELASALSCRESDVVALLNQVPFIDILNLLHAATWTSEQHVLEVIAVASQVISILHTGLYTYSGPRYKHLSKKIARLISLAMHSVADLWKSFQPMHDKIDPAHLAHLQVEYDQLFLRAVNGIYHSQGTGAWQFMVGLPYASISAAATWQVLWLLHKSHEKDPHEICLSPLEICHELRRRNQRLSFNERLSQVPHSEIFFLMTALVDMADSPALAYIVAVDVFEVTYLNINLRSSLAKDGRDLLSALALKQPFVVSVLLDAIENHMLILGAMSCYLMDAMPLELWHPDKEDLDIVAHFLLCYPLDSPQSLLARMLIDALNYGKNEQGQLYLERSLHQFVGVLLLESYKKFCSDSVHKQARYLPFVEAGTCKSSTPTDFGSWEMLLANQQFLVDLQTLVFVDSTSLAAVRRLAGYEHERCVLELLAGTMAHHVKQAKHWGFPSLPVRLWASLLLHLPNIAMHKVASKSKGQSDVMYLLDTLAQLAYFEADCLESVVEQLAALLNNLAERATAPLTMKTWPTVVPFDSAPSFPWFALVSMLAEAVLPSVSVMWEAVLLPAYASCCAIVQLEACLTQLVQRHRQALPTDKAALEALGSDVFFDMVRAAHKETTSYSPTRQFVTLCLDMLGQEFVSNKASQCLPVLQAMLRDPGTISHVSPFFTPAAADDEHPSSPQPCLRVAVQVCPPALAEKPYAKSGCAGPVAGLLGDDAKKMWT